jgi:Na+-translocating ferredoxin:NAD+ oxidoreductase RNF subunit RnfB
VADFTHGFIIDEQRCDGQLACMRACPTQAIRVKAGKARLSPNLCIDCGVCLTACPMGAIRATTQSFAEIDRFQYKVAVPSPVLFGQFPVGISPSHIITGLQALGFDAVWDIGLEIALVDRAISDYVDAWDGPFPLISISCPVIVRLVQVLYPRMVGQLTRVELPREVAARELKRKYSQELGIEQDQIAAVYITPCQAKTISILEPAEGVKSNLEGALGISEVYNDILAAARTSAESNPANSWDRSLSNPGMLRWTTGEAQERNLCAHRYMSVTGLSNIIQVFEDIYKGKLRNVEYLECYACWGGCVSGNLTVDNIYVSRSKIHRFLAGMPDSNAQLEAEVERRYAIEDFSLKGEVHPRTTEQTADSLKERVRRIKVEESVTKALPGLNCGLCGAPTCKTFARDVARGTETKDACIFFSEDRIDQLRETYLGHRKREPTENG